MPFEVDSVPGRPVRVEVLPSAVLELTWLLHVLGRKFDEIGGYDWLQPAAAELREELTDLWGDGFGCVSDTSILAERVGGLLTDEADTFLDGLERAAQLDGAGLELRSESRQDRDATLGRLERLRTELGLARRYAGALRRVWDLARPEWEGTGRDVVRQTGIEWAERLRQGASVGDLLPERHLVRRADMVSLQTLRPRVVLSPMWFVNAGGFVVDMTTYVHLGGPAKPPSEHDLRRKEADWIASRMKVLSDATRVGLLRELAYEPASVMDLARRFGLAQPTVSSHVRLLREAGLLDSRKDGPRIVYSVPRDQLGAMLDQARHLLLEH
jgi:DNA-binding transcriptional ArsR family regulator